MAGAANAVLAPLAGLRTLVSNVWPLYAFTPIYDLICEMMALHVWGLRGMRKSGVSSSAKKEGATGAIRDALLCWIARPDNSEN
jgi:hypothetical protein